MFDLIEVIIKAEERLSEVFYDLPEIFLMPVINSFMTEAVIIYQWTGFYMITASVMKEFREENKIANAFANIETVVISQNCLFEVNISKVTLFSQGRKTKYKNY